ANLFEGVKYINQLKEGQEGLTKEDLDILKNTLNTFVFDVLGLEHGSISSEETNRLQAAVELLIELRQQARDNRDFAMSDKIRDDLAEAGIHLQDGKEGTTFTTAK
ncbi:MAG: cysteine--tRNA ligase, partial [Flavobacteriaceae bacterium]|nr:cysteine--tRNA ligase [Flavobacteriaceae bacterium]